MQISTRSGLTIDGAEERALRFLTEEWAYYDGFADVDPKHVIVNDVLSAAMMNAYAFGVGAAQLRGIHRGLAAACDPLLADIPADADLRFDDPDLARLGALLRAAVSVHGVLLPVATKVLHRKRRQLIPMLDNVLIEYYRDATGRRPLLDRSQDKRRAAEVGLHVLGAFRDDLVGSYDELTAMGAHVAAAGYPVGPLRLLEILVWTEKEPRGYYRQPAA